MKIFILLYFFIIFIMNYNFFQSHSLNISLNLLTSFVGGIIAAIALNLISSYCKTRKFKKHFKPLTKDKFIWFYKHDSERTQQRKTTFKLNSKNITFEGYIGEDPNNNFNGKFTMDDTLENYCRVFYKDSNSIGFGFIELQYNKEEVELYIHCYFPVSSDPQNRTIEHMGFTAITETTYKGT